MNLVNFGTFHVCQISWNKKYKDLEQLYGGAGQEAKAVELGYKLPFFKNILNLWLVKYLSLHQEILNHFLKCLTSTKFISIKLGQTN